MKRILLVFVAFLMSLPSSGCVVILAGGAGAAAAYWYAQNHRKCPYCQKDISTRAVVCYHCHKEVQPTEQPASPYREVAFGKVVCVYCQELIDKNATVCPKCGRNVTPLKEGEVTRDPVMKKIQCPKCKKMISDQATICPNCQTPIPKNS